MRERRGEESGEEMLGDKRKVWRGKERGGEEK